MLKKNIILCGFMGCGKTTVGKVLARRLSVDFIDMDEYLEKREGITIPEMFNRSEQYFREREHEAVAELARLRGIVIAAGGGAITFERNALLLRQSGDIVFLRLDFDGCYSRIAGSDRPLLLSNTRDELKQLFLARKKAYSLAANFEVDASGAPDDIAEAMVKLLGL